MSSSTVATESAVVAAPVVPLARLCFELEALDPIRLPDYSGSAWRGLLGRGLRQSVCVTRQRSCDGCLLLSQCAYSTFFESPRVSPATARRYSVLPHPFVLEPALDEPRSVVPGDSLRLGLTLIGPASELKPHLIHAMQRAGRLGLGSRDGRFRLRRLLQNTRLGRDDWAVVFDADAGALHPARTECEPLRPCPDPLRLQLLTPLRLKRRGRFVDASDLDARDLLFGLATRAATLCELYSPGTPALDLDAVRAAIDGVRLASEGLRWADWTRWSSRQRVHMQLGGLIGTVALSGPTLPALWPLIALGQWLHVGKATSFGLGRYRVSPGDATGV